MGGTIRANNTTWSKLSLVMNVLPAVATSGIKSVTGNAFVTVGAGRRGVNVAPAPLSVGVGLGNNGVGVTVREPVGVMVIVGVGLSDVGLGLGGTVGG